MGEFLKLWLLLTLALVAWYAAFTWLLDTFGGYFLAALVLVVSGLAAHLILKLGRRDG